MVSDVEHAPRALLRLEKDGAEWRTNGPTDGRTPDRYITLTARRGKRNNVFEPLSLTQVRLRLKFNIHAQDFNEQIKN